MASSYAGLLLAAGMLLLSAAAAVAGDAARGRQLFPRCGGCHSTEPGVNKTGPSLAGLLGRPAGSAPGYAYSDALKGAAIVWDEAALDRYLAAPQAVVPGGKMSIPVSRAADRADIIAYLRTLQP